MTSSDDQAQAMLHQLASSTALLPQDIVDDPDAGAAPDGAIALPVIEQDGQQFVPVFTSEEALVAAGADPARAIAVPMAQLAAGLPSDDLWLAIDPASEDGVTLPPDVVRVLPGLAGTAPHGTA